MIALITSNTISVRSLNDYNDNFVISYLRSVKRYPMTKPTNYYIFDIYHQEGMDIGDDYTNTDDMEFHFHPVDSIPTALTEISMIVQEYETKQSELDEDLTEDLTLVSCCAYRWNPQVVKYLNSILAETELETTCLNFYQQMKIPSTQRLVQTLQGVLGTNFIYPDDPIAFGYALYQALNGVF